MSGADTDGRPRPPAPGPAAGARENRRVRSFILDVPSETGMTAVIRGALRGLVESAPSVRLSARELDEVVVVVQEACTNSVRHAHHGDPWQRIQVEFRCHDDGLEVLVRDRGRPFELGSGAPDPEALREGGYGVHIMRSWMDEVGVRRLDNGNELRLFRRYRAARTTAAGGHVAARG